MRFRLPSLFLLITLVAVTIAWYLDHHRHRSDDIVGVWYYPTLDHPFRKGHEILTCSADGTFTLQQDMIATYSGTYTLAGNGIALFHVTSKQCVFGVGPPETYDVDETYRCRVARDSYSNLIVVDLDPEVGSPDLALLRTLPTPSVRAIFIATALIVGGCGCYRSQQYAAAIQAYEESYDFFARNTWIDRFRHYHDVTFCDQLSRDGVVQHRLLLFSTW